MTGSSIEKVPSTYLIVESQKLHLESVMGQYLKMYIIQVKDHRHV